jgi:hypothetical protein
MSGETEPVLAKPMFYCSRDADVSVGGLLGCHQTPHPSSDIKTRDTVDQIKELDMARR